MRRLAPILFTLLALLATDARSADAPAPGEILARLQAAAPSEVAWGAYLAGEHGVTESVPLLVAALRPQADRDGDDWVYTRRAVLDALIRLDARVPGEILAPHLRGHLSHLALIVAAREPVANHELLLDLLDRQSRGEQVGVGGLAAGNLLCTQKAPGFAARFLPWIEMRLTIRVRDPGNGFGGRVSSRCLTRFGDGVIEIPEGFPPYARYELLTGGKVTAGTPVVFAPGLRPVSYLRTERTERRFGVGGASRSVDKGVVAREWMAVLAGTDTAQLGLPAQRSPTHEWSNPGAYVAWAVAQQDAALRRYWAVVKIQIERKALTVDEARALEPRVEVKVMDRRTEPNVPLPALPTVTVRPDFLEPKKDR